MSIFKIIFESFKNNRKEFSFILLNMMSYPLVIVVIRLAIIQSF